MNNYFETPPNEELAPTENLDRLMGAIQETTGLTLPQGYPCLLIPSIDELSVTNTRELIGVKTLKLKQGCTYFETIHELGHLLTDDYYENITDSKVRASIIEGVNDLIALTISNIPFSEYRKVLRQLGNKTLADFSEDEVRTIQDIFLGGNESKTYTIFQERSIEHIVGRSFISYFIDSGHQIDLKKILVYLYENPPTREQLLNPEKYIKSYENYEFISPEPITPNKISFTTKRPRII